MKVFISADIEGTAVTATREGCRPGEFEYERSRKEMTAEVVAAAEGARAAGAELVVVKDAHGPGLNILPEELPGVCPAHPKLERLTGDDGGRAGQQLRCRLFRGLSQCGGEGGNALSHTINGGVVHRITVNGQPASEFLITVGWPLGMGFQACSSRETRPCARWGRSCTPPWLPCR